MFAVVRHKSRQAAARHQGPSRAVGTSKKGFGDKLRAGFSSLVSLLAAGGAAAGGGTAVSLITPFIVSLATWLRRIGKRG